MTYEEYIALGFAVLFATFGFALKDKLVRRLSLIFSVAFLLRAVVSFIPQKFLEIAILLYSYLLLVIAFFYSVRITKAMKTIRKKAYMDSLTGVNNRNFFEEVLKKELKDLESLGVSYGIIFIDLYKIKNINDTYGHIVGDRILLRVGEIIKRSLRRDDIVVRYGGDEFVVVVFNAEKEKMETIVQRLSESLRFKEGNIEVIGNVGWATYPEDGKNLDDVLNVASLRMYKDKKSYRFYT